MTRARNTADEVSLITAKGDLLAGSASGVQSKLAVGTNGQALLADSTTSTGLKWGSASSAFAGCSIYNSADVSLTSGTATAITCDSEFYDTDGYHSTSSNTSRITIPSGKGGYYLIQGYTQYAANATGNRTTSIRKNGSTILLQNLNSVQPEASRSTNIAIAYVGNFAVADYIELFGVQNTGGALTIQMVPSYTFHFSATYLGA